MNESVHVWGVPMLGTVPGAGETLPLLTDMQVWLPCKLFSMSSDFLRKLSPSSFFPAPHVLFLFHLLLPDSILTTILFC